MHKFRLFLAESIGTFALIFVGIGAIKALSDDLLGIALAHGLTIAVFASATGFISGGHLNPAVTFGVWLAGKIRTADTVLYIIAQLFGATVAGLIYLQLFGARQVVDGTPQLLFGLSLTKAILIEAILTFFLVFVVFGTAVDRRAPKLGGLAIGLTVTLDILVGGPLTGAAMNPARVFGPALAAGFWHNHSVYWIGPLIGAAVAGLTWRIFLLEKE